MKDGYLGVVGRMDYECWRISSDVIQSISSCSDGEKNKCLNYSPGDVCSMGHKIKL